MPKKTKQQRITEYKEEMKRHLGDGDTCVQHSNADRLLCRLLNEIGYGEIVEIYEDVDKWYE